MLEDRMTTRSAIEAIRGEVKRGMDQYYADRAAGVKNRNVPSKNKTMELTVYERTYIYCALIFHADAMQADGNTTTPNRLREVAKRFEGK